VPALDVPRFVHGQSQGICDIFGVSVSKQPDGYYFVCPFEGGANAVDKIKPRPISESMYWGAVEWVRHARRATSGCFPFRNAVMCGPLDLANYLLGTTRLMEWLYTEPETVHRLLHKITDVIIDTVRALREAAGGTLHPLHVGVHGVAQQREGEKQAMLVEPAWFGRVGCRVPNNGSEVSPATLRRGRRAN